MYFWLPTNAFTSLHSHIVILWHFCIHFCIQFCIQKCLLEIYDLKRRRRFFCVFFFFMFILISSFAVIQLVLRKEVPSECSRQGVACLELCTLGSGLLSVSRATVLSSLTWRSCACCCLSANMFILSHSNSRLDTVVFCSMSPCRTSVSRAFTVMMIMMTMTVDDDCFTDRPLVYSPALPAYLTINARTRPDWRPCCSPPSWWEWCTRCTASCCTASCRSPPPRARSPTAPGSSRWLCKASVSSTVSPCLTSPPSRYPTDKPSPPLPSVFCFHFSHVELPQIRGSC